MIVVVVVVIAAATRGHSGPPPIIPLLVANMLKCLFLSLLSNLIYFYLYAFPFSSIFCYHDYYLHYWLLPDYQHFIFSGTKAEVKGKYELIH